MVLHYALLQTACQRRQHRVGRQSHPEPRKHGPTGPARRRQPRAGRQPRLQGSERGERQHVVEGHPVHGAPRELRGDPQGRRRGASLSRGTRKILDNGRVPETVPRVLEDHGPNERYGGNQQQGTVGGGGGTARPL